MSLLSLLNIWTGYSRIRLEYRQPTLGCKLRRVIVIAIYRVPPFYSSIPFVTTSSRDRSRYSHFAGAHHPTRQRGTGSIATTEFPDRPRKIPVKAHSFPVNMATAQLAIPPPIYSPFLDEQCGKIDAKGVSWEVSASLEDDVQTYEAERLSGSRAINVQSWYLLKR